MPVTVSPETEACTAIAARINSAITYVLPRPAEYVQDIIDVLDEVEGFQVDVVCDKSEQLQTCLDIEDRSSHMVRVWVRDKLDNMLPATVEARLLLVRKIFQRVNDYTTPNGRVSVWDCGKDRQECPGKFVLVEKNFFRAYVEMRVEVEPS